jgi:tetraacyldisaccharide 4'-kinase
VLVVVHEKRVKAIEYIQKNHPDINVILMDDGFQHRYVTPGMNLLITEYYKPFFRNYILPCGTLRESKYGCSRAHALIVSKTPKVFSPLDRRFFLNKLKPYYQNNIFFSYIKYGDWIPFDSSTPEILNGKFRNLFLFTAIANTSALEEHLKTFCIDLEVIEFRDHYQFNKSDLHELKRKFFNTYGKSKAIVITEKDAMRLQDKNLKAILKNLPVYYIPIEVDFQREDKKSFNEFICSFLKAYQGNI